MAPWAVIAARARFSDSCSSPARCSGESSSSEAEAAMVGWGAGDGDGAVAAAAASTRDAGWAARVFGLAGLAARPFGAAARLRPAGLALTFGTGVSVIQVSSIGRKSLYWRRGRLFLPTP